jgi:predicted RNase H-like nuclease
VRCLGIDFGWQGKPSGLAMLSWEGSAFHLRSTERISSLDEIIAWVANNAGEDGCFIGIDAPIVIRNETGMRDCDRLMHRHYGKYHAGAYPANLNLPHARRPLELSQTLELIGFLHGPGAMPRSSGRFQIEVHPHAAMVQLFALPQIIKYKRGRLAERRVELVRYRELMMARLPVLTPSCILGDAIPEVPCVGSGSSMKDAEDRMDAIMSAYVAAHWWYWGRERNDVCGDVEKGYIVVPNR